MGIKGLPQFLSKNTPELFVTVALSLFSGHRIAVDASVYLYRFMSSALKSNGSWFDSFLKFIMHLRKNNIRPVFVFDGPAPIQKDRTQNKRRATRHKIEQKATECLELLIMLDPDEYGPDSGGVKVDINADLLERARGVLTSKKNPDPDVDSMTRKRLIYELDQVYKKFSSQCMKPTPNDATRIKDLLDALGLPWIQAEGEAEKTCSWLCYHGYVKAVLSTDSDVLVYGAPIFMKNVRDGQDECTITYNEEVLARLEMTKPQFIDFCILCGTDYNDNLDGIGAATAYEKMLKFKSLEALEDSGTNLDSLFYDDGRRLFTLDPDKKDFKIPSITQPNKKDLNMLLFKNNSKISIEDVLDSIYKPKFVITD